MSEEQCTAQKCRGRPTMFDRDELIDQVMELFWERGYKNLSFNEIAKQTGVTRASLYNAFSTKAGLFQEAIQRYFAASPAKTLSNVREGQRIGPVLHRLFEGIAEVLAADSRHRGCLVVNCLSECSQEDTQFRAQLEDIFSNQFHQFKRLVELAVQQGELPAETDSEITSAIIQSFLNGFSLYSKNGASFETLVGISGTFLVSLGFHAG